MAQATTMAAPAAETIANNFLVNVYLLMFVGLAVTGLVSYWVSENMQIEALLIANGSLGWGLFIAQVMKETKNGRSDDDGGTGR